MKHIDFLPDIYRQQRVQRRARRWWCTVAGIFAAAILAASLSQWMLRRSIQREQAEVEPKYAAALRREAELALLKQEIAREEEVAGLYAYLAHPWPRTQILAAVVRPLPDSIRLSEIRIAFELLPQGAVILPASSTAQGGKAKQTPSPASQDLTQLRNECDGRQVVLSITGTATVLTDLHAYVDHLGKSPLIAAAHLKGVESAGTGQATGEARFHVHVVVLSGYGQAGGPPLDSDVKGPAPKHSGQMSEVRHQTSEVTTQGAFALASDLRTPTSDLRSPASDVRPPHIAQGGPLP